MDSGMRLLTGKSWRSPVKRKNRIHELATSSETSWQALRKLAEASATITEGMVTMKPEEANRMMHELHVHQIELEMQNEELRRVQAELDASRARYFDLYDLAPVGYCTLSENGLILETNLTAATLLGISRRMLTGHPIQNFILKEDQDIFYLKRKQLFETREPKIFELRLLKNDGTVFWAHMTAAITDDPDGTPVCRLALTDITERRLAEDALKESEEKNRLLIEESLDAIIISDESGRILTWNKAMKDLTDIRLSPSEENTVWYLLYQLAPVDVKTPDLLELFKAEYSRMLHKSKTRQGSTNERKIRLPNGSFKTVKESSFLIDTTKGIMHVSILHDISDHIQKEDELRIAKVEAEAANAASTAKSQFIANMSHEIRTPLNGFMGVLQLLEMTELTDEQRDYIEISKSASDSLMTVINDILDYSKIEAGKMELAEVPFSLRKAVHDIERFFRASALNNGLNFSVTIDEEVPDRFIGDSFRLKQILSNLIGNAIKFTRVGSILISAGVLDELRGGMVNLEFTVSDTGIGIANDRMESLFKSFSQISNSVTEKYGGTGLGLVISKQLVEMMNGEIWAESIENGGSDFHFSCILKKDAVGD